MESCTSGTYANMWEVYGVSSVIGIMVQSIYPQYNKRHRAAFNKLIQPRVFSSCSNDKCRVLTIMWTRLQAPPSTAQQWSPNHFVPCMKTSLISPSQPSHFPYAKAQQPNTFKSPVTNSCPKLSTILLSRQCGGKSMRKFPNLKATPTTKSRSSPSCENQSFPISLSSGPNNSINGTQVTTQCSDSLWQSTTNQCNLTSKHIPTSTYHEQHHSLKSQISKPRPSTSSLQSNTVPKSSSDIEVRTSTTLSQNPHFNQVNSMKKKSHFNKQTY